MNIFITSKKSKSVFSKCRFNGLRDSKFENTSNFEVFRSKTFVMQKLNSKVIWIQEVFNVLAQTGPKFKVKFNADKSSFKNRPKKWPNFCGPEAGLKLQPEII